jgi:ribosomal protein S27AE
MEYTLEYLNKNFGSLSIDEQDNILAQLSQKDQDRFWAQLYEPFPEEVLDPKFDLKLARSQNTRNINLARTKEQYQNIVEKIAQQMRGERACIRSKKAAETLGTEGCKNRVKKAMQTIGKEGFKARTKKAMQTIGKEGLKERAKKAIQTLGAQGCSERSSKIAKVLGEEGCKNRALKAAETTALKRYNSLSDSEKLIHDNRYCPHCGKGLGLGYRKRKLEHINNCKKKSEKNNKL